jgi:hypothetical protein
MPRTYNRYMSRRQEALSERVGTIPVRPSVRRDLIALADEIEVTLNDVVRHGLDLVLYGENRSGFDGHAGPARREQS